MVIAGTLFYVGGLLWMAIVAEPTAFVIGSGILIGAALACTAFGAVSGIIGRAAPEAKRSWSFGISGAASSFGQFVMMPVEQQLISSTGWQTAFYILAAMVALVMPSDCAWKFVRMRCVNTGSATASRSSMRTR